MPFIDLSSPQDNNTTTNNAVSNNAQQNAPQVNQQVQQTPQIQQSQHTMRDNKVMRDEHSLMNEVRDLSVDAASTQVADDGVKIISGPPLPNQQKTEDISASTTDPAQVAQVSQVSPPTIQVNDQTANNLENSPKVNNVQNIQTAKPISEIPNANQSQVQVNNQSRQVKPLIQPQSNNASQSNQVSQVNSQTSGMKQPNQLPPLDDSLLDSNELSRMSNQVNNQLQQDNSGIPGLDQAGLLLKDSDTIGDFLSIAEKYNASDLHLSVGYSPLLRIDGDLVSIGGSILTEDRIEKIFSALLNPKLQEILERDKDVDFSHTHTSGNRFRINLFHKKNTLAGAFRLIPSTIHTISELGLPEIMYSLTDLPNGLVLLAGPTGSGKSTTIASVIQEINMTKDKHIITLEDPIEYIFPKGRALINQREIGSDVTSFKRGLREVLRQDPDVVLVGEMRDYETIAMTITSAETGHLVFSTLHTNSASQTVDRMIDVFPEAQQAQVRAQLANVLSAVVSQRLVPIKGGGRVAVHEVMIATPAIRNAIREAKTYQIDNMIQTSAEMGMVTLEKSLADLVRSGKISVEDAQTYTSKPEELMSLLKSN